MHTFMNRTKFPCLPLTSQYLKIIKHFGSLLWFPQKLLLITGWWDTIFSLFICLWFHFTECSVQFHLGFTMIPLNTEIEDLVFPRFKLARNCSRAAVSGRLYLNKNLFFLSFAQRIWNVKFLFRILIKPQIKKSESSTKKNITQENCRAWFAKHFITLYWMTSKRWILQFWLCCDTEQVLMKTLNCNNGIVQLHFFPDV